ncbi:MAG: hypothetical protein K6T92_02395 [Candidatus Rokubacteria bacterium]|nr:hypothetical protein [Candidatus Rokubacteria bacterium]
MARAGHSATARAGRALGVLGALLLTAGPPSAGALAAAREPVPAAVHVHSDLSTGDLPLVELARRAAREGIGALFLAENYRLRIEYGLPPFRALTRVTFEDRSVQPAGLADYLTRVEQARRQVPEVLLVPGVEVLPHYRWSGSPLALSLTLHDTQKNLLVFGLDAAALGSLPVAGQRVRYGWQSVLDALPGLLVAAGLVVLGRKRLERKRLRRTVVVRRRRRWLTGSLLIGLGVLAIVRGWPFAEDRFPPWEDFGVAPHQAVIDHVVARGGAVAWSFPEAPDAGARRFGPVTVRWRTDPFPDDLLRTSGYTAFGGLYEQPTRVVEPGGVWDRVLAQYAACERPRPAWALGEAGFHGPASGKRLGTVQTVFVVEERSERGLLDALARGRLYALARTPEAALVLAEFRLTAGEATAEAGDTVRVPPGTPVELRATIDVSDGSRPLVRVSLVRNGQVAEAWAGRPPLAVSWRGTFDGRPLVLRLDARGQPPHRILSGPIVVVAP